MSKKIIPSFYNAWKIFWRSGLFFIVWGLLLALFFVPFGPGLAILQKTSPIKAQLYADIASAITILIATWLATRFIDRRPFLTIGFAFDHIFKDSLTGLALGAAWLGVSIGTAWVLGWASPLAPIGFSWLVLAGASIAMLFNILTQELLLCGFIFQTIRSKSNVIIAIIVSAFLFSSYHAGAFKGEWLPIVNVFAAGLLFCLAYVITGNLWLPISIHFAWNVLLGPVLGLTESGVNDLGGGWKMFAINGPYLFTGGKFGLEGGLIITISVFLMIVLIYYFRRR
jgi:uncharacterized protein